MKKIVTVGMGIIAALAASQAAKAASALVCDLHGNDNRDIPMVLASETSALQNGATLAIRIAGILDTEYKLRVIAEPTIAEEGGRVAIQVQQISETGVPATDPLEATLDLPMGFRGVQGNGTINVTRIPAESFPPVHASYPLTNCRGIL